MFLQVFGGGTKTLRVIFGDADNSVAIAAQERTDLSGFVIVIDAEIAGTICAAVDFALWIPADGAYVILGIAHALKRGNVDTVSRFQPHVFCYFASRR